MDANENEFSSKSNGREVSQINEIPQSVIDAFIVTEDKRFYSHNGVDFKGLARAFVNNIKTLSFKEGGSTISQQLIKNTHLSNEKTIKRKLVELKLASQLEKEFSKQEIIEMYLNTIYFGDGCYGITNASKHYFNKNVNQLTVEEGVILASIVKAPSSYSPTKNPSNCIKRSTLVLNLLNKKNYENIDKTKIESIVKNINNNLVKNDFDYAYMANNEAMKIIDNCPYISKKYYVKTYLDNNLQENIIDEFSKNISSYHKTIIVNNNKAETIAYLSSCGDVKRQSGSILKPLVVYAPCIQEGIVDSCTKINDEITNFNGYTPKNFNNKYYGLISVKDSLAKSSNVCAVKLIEKLGINKSVEYAKRLNLNIQDDDKNLSFALGATKNGLKLTEILNGYSVFNNEGEYKKASFVDYIKLDNGQFIYKNIKKSNKIFDKDTTEIMNDMLYNTVSNGTARKLKKLNFPICAKTGTVGTLDGNTDLYSISYNKEYSIATWIGATDKKLDNSLLGGGLPTNISFNIWRNIYNEKTPPNDFGLENCIKCKIDKISYDTENIIEIADEITPNELCFDGYFTRKSVPTKKSTRFSSPKIDDYKLSVNNNGICIWLCLTQQQKSMLIRTEGNKKRVICKCLDVNNNSYIDNDIKPGKEYTYSIRPFYEINGKTYYGNEKIIGKIKSPINFIGDDWLND